LDKTVQRKLYTSVREWKAQDDPRPLMLIGARQVGKTYLIREFCQREFADYVEFNFFDRPDVVAMLAEDIPTQQKIDRLGLYAGRSIDFTTTALFFDEIQESEDAIAMLKYFAESPVPYKVLCAGSLLGVKLKRLKKAFPVGKVKKLYLHTMDFEEFLLASGEGLLRDEIRRCFLENRQMANALHLRCMDMYRSYLCIGGMPAAVSDYLTKDRDILRFDTSILTDIRSDYLADMTKHIDSPIEAARIERIYSSLPAQLGNTSRKFQYSKVREGAKSREYYSALDWLVSSGMTLQCLQVAKPEKPLRGNERAGFFKLFLNDSGLLCNAIRLSFTDIMLDRDMPFKGVLAENYVAIQLAANSCELFYWLSENSAEIDFLLEGDSGIVPAEVKAGEHKYSASLRSYTQKYGPEFSVRITALNFGLTNTIKSVPLYAAFCLPGVSRGRAP
jgi:predicted AAA+ superfamily ATPase